MILWDVDTQADFLLPGGKLYVPGAESLLPNLKRLTEWAEKSRTLVIASVDAHKEGDEEFKDYPPHCLAGTPGQQKIPETRLAKQHRIPNRPATLPRDLSAYQQVIIEKQRTDVFTNPNIEALLARLGSVDRIVLYGVVTEICVAHTARGLVKRGFRIAVVEDAIRPLDEAKSRDLLEDVRRRGGSVVRTDDVVGETLRASHGS